MGGVRHRRLVCGAARCVRHVDKSSFALLSTRVVMSDALAALLIVVSVPLIKVNMKWSVYLLGLLAGYGVVIRESGIIVVACVLIVMTQWDRLHAAEAGASLPILGLAVYNWSTFGSPWMNRV